MPKGVVWRHEDIFKSAMGGGDLTQGGDYVSGPKELAERLPENGIVALAAPPLMHAAAHWLTFHQLFAGGDGRADAAAVASTRREVWETIAREKRLQHRRSSATRWRSRCSTSSRRTPARTTPSACGSSRRAARALSQHNKDRLATLLPGRCSSTRSARRRPACSGPKDGRRRFTAERAHRRARRRRRRGRRPATAATGKVARRGHVPLGYYNDPEKTAATFVEVDGVRWALPGDMATVESDGTVQLLGRGSQCINTGGEKVYPEEVEEPLKAHPAVDDALVVGVPDERWGERVVAVVQPAPGATLDLAALQEHVREHVAGYKVPRELVLVDEVVRSPAGKADYRWAKEHAVDASLKGRPDGPAAGDGRVVPLHRVADRCRSTCSA